MTLWQVLGMAIGWVGLAVALVGSVWSKFNREVARSAGERPAGSLAVWAVSWAGMGLAALGSLVLGR